MSAIRVGFVCFLLGLSSAASAADDIDSLLKQVDSALGDPPQKSSTKQSESPSDTSAAPPVVRRSGKRKTNSPPQNPQNFEATPLSPALPDNNSNATRYSLPLDHSSLSELLKADTSSRVSDLRSPTQGAIFRVGALAYGLGAGYVLSKDDDSFHLQPSTLGGVTLSFQPSWYLGILSSDSIQTRLTFSLGAGAAYGTAEVIRSGVMSGREVYSFFLIPVQTEIGLLVQLGPIFGVQVAYGYGVDLLNQRGLGVSDTTNGWFGSDLLSVTVRVLWDSQTEVFTALSSKGIGLLPQPEGVSGFMVRAGVGFHLGG